MNDKSKKSLTFLLVGLVHYFFLFGFSSSVDNTKHIFSKKVGDFRYKISVKIDESKANKQDQIKKLKRAPLKSKKKNLSRKKQRKRVKQDGKSIASGKDHLLQKYLSEIRTKIANSTIKTRLAKRLNLFGEVKISFNIRSPNLVGDLRVIHSSGYPALDDSAIATIEAIESLPAIPKELEIKTLPILTSVIYE